MGHLSTSHTAQHRYWFAPRKTVSSVDIYGTRGLPSAIPLYAIQVANSIDIGYISARYTNFVSENRRLIESGSQADDLLGPIEVDPSQLLDITTAGLENPTLCQWATGLVQDTSMDLMCVGEKLAMILLTALLARVGPLASISQAALKT
jgi:hypothetical protein